MDIVYSIGILDTMDTRGILYTMDIGYPIGILDTMDNWGILKAKVNKFIKYFYHG